VSGIFLKDIEDDEVSFIVLYIAAAVERVTLSRKNVYAVCTTGRGSAQLLLINLKNKFPGINIIDTISIQTASKLTKDKADAIISTTYFHNKEIQVIVVSPLLLKEDILKIRKNLMVESVEEDKKQLTLSNHESSFLDYMYMLGDCATTVEELSNSLHITFSNSEHIGVMMHLMMQIYQSINEENIVVEELDEHDLIIYQSLSTLYRKYNKYPSNYDIRSINVYIKNERE
jgi:transcriptional antiterminator